MRFLVLPEMKKCFMTCINTSKDWLCVQTYVCIAIKFHSHRYKNTIAHQSNCIAQKLISSRIPNSWLAKWSWSELKKYHLLSFSNDQCTKTGMWKKWNPLAFILHRRVHIFSAIYETKWWIFPLKSHTVEFFVRTLFFAGPITFTQMLGISFHFEARQPCDPEKVPKHG